MYRLKNNVADFVCVDGPMARRSFRQGVIYAEIPPEEQHKFEDPAPQVAPPDETKSAGRSRGKKSRQEEIETLPATGKQEENTTNEELEGGGAS